MFSPSVSLPLHKQTGLNFVFVELFDDTGGAFVKFRAVFVRPPRFEISVRIEFTALIVEAVRDFVSDDTADSAVIDRVVGFEIKERRLQDSGGKNDFIEYARIICVDRRRSHSPARAVNGFSDVLQITFDLKLIRVYRVLHIRIAADRQTFVTAQNIRVADLSFKGREFFLRLNFRFIAHPIQTVESFLHRDKEIGDQVHPSALWLPA